MNPASREIQIEIADATVCAGTCAGCSLPNEIKHSAHREGISTQMRELINSRLEEYLSALDGYDSITITYSVGDHFLYADHYIQAIYQDAVQLIKRAGVSAKGGSAVSVTASLVGKSADLHRRLAFHASLQDPDVPFIPVVVFDPKKLQHRKFAEGYLDTIKASSHAFSKVDFSVNLSSEVVRAITPEDLLTVASEHGFEPAVINWQMTTHNLENTWGCAATIEEIKEWIIRYDTMAMSESAASSYGYIMGRVLGLADALAAGGHSLISNEMREVIFHSISRTLLIDGEGNVYPKFEAIGDIPHGKEYGYEAMGNIADASIAEIIATALPKVHRRIVMALSGHACAGCRHVTACALSGFHVYNHVIQRAGKRDTPESCPHIAMGFFDYCREAKPCAS